MVEFRVKNNFILVLAVIMALSMIIPGTVMFAQDMETGNLTEYYTVVLSDTSELNTLNQAPDVQVVRSDSTSAVIRTTPEKGRELGHAFSMTGMPDRTQIKFMEAGIEFDSRSGYDVPQQWRSQNSELYMVQFVAPMTQDWLDSVKGKALGFYDTVGDNVAILKLGPGQKAQIESLDFVEWVGTYEPYFKVYERARQESGYFNVGVTPTTVTTDQLAQALASMGAEIILNNPGCNKVEARINDAMLPQIAKLDSVGLVEYKNKNIGDEIQQSSMSGETVGAHVVWDTSRNNLPQQITGEGQVYHHQDLGLDDTHLDFTAGPLGNRILYCQDTGDPDDHSTGCVGIAAGNGYCMETWLGLSTSNQDYNEIAASNPLGMLDRTGFAGRAPETYIVAYDNLNNGDMDASYTTYNSRVFSHSWAPSADIESGYFSDVDTFMLSHTKGLVCFCACNWGPNEGTVTGYGNCKNGLSIGAAENNRQDWFQTDDNPWGIWTSSAKGPVSVSDMRVKPDVVEVGAGVIICQSDDEAAHDDSIYRGGNNDGTLMIDSDSDGRPDYRKNQGTSFSCPAAAGDAILIRDYLVDILGYDNNPSEGTNEPDALLIKAYLIHGAQDMGYGYPSYGQGWGLCSPEYSISPPAPLSNKNWSGTGNSGPITIDVVSSAAPLKITMCHWDTGTASGALTVDYDLKVTAPDMTTTYYGNAFAESESIPLNPANDWSSVAFPSWSAYPSAYPTGHYDWDTADDGGDDINNVEVILINEPAKGEWTIEVVEKSGSAMWHVIASADFGAYHDYQVEVSQDTSKTYHMRDGYGTQSYQAGQGDTIAVGFTVQNFGLNSDTITLSASYQGDGSVPGDPLPLGWTVTFDTGTSLSLMSEEITHVTAYITSPPSASEGAYPIRILAESGGSSSEDYIVLNYDVVNQRLPDKIQVTDTKLPETNPCIASWGSYVVIAYLQDTGIGERVFVSVSSDGGQTWGSPVQVTDFADDPQCIELKVAPAGHTYAGRMFIAYNSLRPLGNGDTWEEASNRRCVCAFADAPYGDGDWTITFPFNNGEGPDTYNDYREIDIGFYLPNEVHFIENNYYFGSSNNMNQNPNSISPYERISTDGGSTWPTGNDLSVGGSNQYSLSASNDGDGDLVFSCYMTGTDRKMYYRNYAGSWGSAVVAMEFPPNDAMWGYCGADPVNDRTYVVAGQSNGNNYNDFKLPYVTYTDNDGGAFASPVGVLGGSANRCDNGHFDSNKMMDMDVTSDGIAWASVKQHPTSTANPYWSYNLYSASSAYSDGYSPYTDNQVTRDSFAKEPGFRATAIGSDLGLAYTAFEEGPSDIFFLRLYDGWQTDSSDTKGPITMQLQAPDRWIQYKALNVVAQCSEINSGYNDIQAAEYRWDSGSSTALDSVDGTFDGPVESVEATDSMSLDVGWHYLEVRGQDSIGNWGEWEGKYIYIYSRVFPDEPQFSGLEKVVNLGTGNSLRLYWTAASDPNGNEYPITYHIYRSTTPGFVPNNSTNRIDFSQQSTEPQIGNAMYWDDTSVTEGQTYYYIVRSADAGNEPVSDPVSMDMNTEERSATVEELVFFQVQSPGAGYRNLNLDAFEASTQTYTTGVIDAAGEYQLDPTDGKWLSSAMTYDSDMNGTWRFYVNGFMNNDRTSGYLYAKVYRYSDTSLQFTTGYDDQDISGYTGTYHQFVWDYTVSPGSASITTGDQYYVELWLHVTSVTSGGSGASVDYDFSTGAGTDKWYYDCSWASNPPTGASGAREWDLPTAGGSYSQIEASDNTWSTAIDAGTGYYAAYKIVMNLDEAPTEIDSITMQYEAGTAGNDDGYPTELYVWNTASTSWLYITETQLPRTTSDGLLSGTLSSSTTGFTQWSDYVDSGNSNQFIWLVFHTYPDANNHQTRLLCDYCRATVTQVAGPDGQFTFGYDSEAAPSAVHPSLPDAAASPTYAYDIPISPSMGNGDWVFVSFPYVMGGDVLTMLDDSIYGDGATTWDIAKWYDPTDANDPWKTYNTNLAAGLNDFPTMDQTMGVWLRLTGHGGDNVLTTGFTGDYSGSAVMMTLQAGWNLVGYPSATDRAADVALAGTSADMIAVYQSGAPYVSDTTALDSVTMTEAEAYWVHVPATTPWSLDP